MHKSLVSNADVAHVVEIENTIASLQITASHRSND